MPEDDWENEVLDELPEEYKDHLTVSPDIADYVMQVRLLQMEAEFSGKPIPYDDVDLIELLVGHPVDYVPRDDEEKEG